jgi:integrase
MCGVALLTRLRRGELFAMRWQVLDLDAGVLAVQEAVYEGSFGTPKTVAGVRSLPLAETAVQLLRSWRQRAKRTGPEDLVFSTVGETDLPEQRAATVGVPGVCRAWATERLVQLDVRGRRVMDVYARRTT